MMAQVAAVGIVGIWRELCHTARRGRQVWRLVPWRHRGALGGALLVMCLASAGNTAAAVYLGRLLDSVDPSRAPGRSPDAIMRTAAGSLGMIGLAYLVRESMNVLRRLLVERTCTR